LASLKPAPTLHNSLRDRVFFRPSATCHYLAGV
jgi:hypothetical protein